MKKKLLSILTTLVILTSLVNTNVNVHAATHTHSFNFTAIEETLAGYNSSGHIIKGTIYYVCDCGASDVDIQYKTDAHNKTHTDFHRGTQIHLVIAVGADGVISQHILVQVETEVYV